MKTNNVPPEVGVSGDRSNTGACAGWLLTAHGQERAHHDTKTRDNVSAVRLLGLERIVSPAQEVRMGASHPYKDTDGADGRGRLRRYLSRTVVVAARDVRQPHQHQCVCVRVNISGSAFYAVSIVLRG